MGVGLPHSLPRRVREGDGEERAPGANCNHAQARRWWRRRGGGGGRGADGTKPGEIEGAAA